MNVGLDLHFLFQQQTPYLQMIARGALVTQLSLFPLLTEPTFACSVGFCGMPAVKRVTGNGAVCRAEQVLILAACRNWPLEREASMFQTKSHGHSTRYHFHARIECKMRRAKKRALEEECMKLRKGERRCIIKAVKVAGAVFRGCLKVRGHRNQ